MRLSEAHAERAGALPLATRSDGQNATSFVHDYLKNLILDLVIPPDTIVTEMQVATATHLSRTPVREAFLRLHEERLVELIPRGGTLVPRITSRQVRELYETRLLHEMHAVCRKSPRSGGNFPPPIDMDSASGGDGGSYQVLPRRFRCGGAVRPAIRGSLALGRGVR
jgi:hypothetical protein